MKEKTIDLGSKLSFQQTNEFVESVKGLLVEEPDRIIVDMTQCVYLNSIMLSGLIRSHKLCEKKKTPFILTNVSSGAYTLFETTNVLEFFAIDLNESDPGEDNALHVSFEVIEPRVGLFKITGNLDGPIHCQKFRQCYEKNLFSITVAILELNPSEHVGSSGVNELFRLRGMLQEKGGALFVISQSPAIESIWRMMHIHSLIPLMSSLDEAKKQLKSQNYI